MDRWKRRAIGYFLFIGFALVITALGFQWGMRVYEDRPLTFLASLQFAAEMFTTTGFGGHSPWQTAEMNLFITVADLLGMAILVGTLPVLVGPLLESALSTAAPKRLASSIDNHVVICSDTTRAEELIDELVSHDVPYVIIEPERERANVLFEEGHQVIRANPESPDGLEAAQHPSARALFVDLSDRVDASVVLAAKEVAEAVPVVSVIEDPDQEQYHRLAGADHVLSPRSLLGESLARKVTAAELTGIDEVTDIGGGIRLAEVSIRQDSKVAGSTLADSVIRETTGVNVIGAWIQGTFNPAPTPSIRLEGGTVLIVAGSDDQLEQLVDLTRSPVRRFQAGETVVVGYGQVGRATAAELDGAGIPHSVVDKVDMEGVDIVGDATDSETFISAGVDQVESIVLALPDDTTTEFATLVIHDLAPEIEVIARVEEKANVSKTYRAGADYVLALAMVTGRLSADHLIDDRDVMSAEQQVEVVRQRVPSLEGRTVGEANIREETGCTVVAIERDDAVITDIGPQTTIEPDDGLVIVGSDEGIRSFEAAFGTDIG